MGRIADHLWGAARKDKKGTLHLLHSTLTSQKELLKRLARDRSVVIVSLVFYRQGFGFIRPLTDGEMKEIAGEEEENAKARTEGLDAKDGQGTL